MSNQVDRVAEFTIIFLDSLSKSAMPTQSLFTVKESRFENLVNMTPESARKKFKVDKVGLEITIFRNYDRIYITVEKGGYWDYFNHISPLWGKLMEILK
jgi:hypothetical protein